MGSSLSQESICWRQVYLFFSLITINILAILRSIVIAMNVNFLFLTCSCLSFTYFKHALPKFASGSFLMTNFSPKILTKTNIKIIAFTMVYLLHPCLICPKTSQHRSMNMISSRLGIFCLCWRCIL